MSRDYVRELTGTLLRRIPQLSPEDAQELAESMFDELIDAVKKGGRPASITERSDGKIEISYLFLEDPFGNREDACSRKRRLSLGRRR